MDWIAAVTFFVGMLWFAYPNWLALCNVVDIRRDLGDECEMGKEARRRLQCELDVANAENKKLQALWQELCAKHECYTNKLIDIKCALDKD